MDCLYCGKPVRVETVQEITRYFKKERKVQVYYCKNEACEELPYLYRERKVEIDAYDLTLEVKKDEGK